MLVNNTYHNKCFIVIITRKCIWCEISFYGIYRKLCYNNVKSNWVKFLWIMEKPVIQWQNIKFCAVIRPPKGNVNCVKHCGICCCQVAKGEPAQTPICSLNIVLPDTIIPEAGPSEPDLLELEKNYSFLRDGISRYQSCSYIF